LAGVGASALVTCLLVVAPASMAGAESYETDPTYAVTRTGNPSSTDFVEALAVQPDGRALVAGWSGGDLDIVRFGPSGGLDPTWGSDGKVTLDGGTWGSARGMALQPDGKVVVVGAMDENTNPALVVVRFLPNGDLDPSFGFDGGIAVRANNYFGGLTAVTIAPDGSIVAAGDMGSGAEDVVVLVLTPDGQLDPDFGDGGIATTVTSRFEYTTGVAVDADGVVTVLGQAATPQGQTSEYDVFLQRYLPTGDLDPTFGTGGVVTSDFGNGATTSYDVAGDILTAAGGAVVISAGRAIGTQGDSDDGVFVARYQADGTLDPSFGFAAGRAMLGDGNWYGTDAARTLQVDGAGRYLVSGSALGRFDSGEAIRRFDPSGAPDTSFGTRGKAVADLVPNSYEQGIGAIGPDGTFIVAGVFGGNTVDGRTDIVEGRLRVQAAQPLPAGPPPAPPPPSPSQRSGYWMVSEVGDVYAFGDAAWLGNAPVGREPAVDLEPSPSGNGYWIVDRAGHVFAFGDAPYLGGVNGAVAFGETVTSISRTPGRGYWIFTSRGRVIPFGDAEQLGDMSTTRLNGPVLDAIPTPSGHGYYLVGSDGGIFTFGDATFAGSMGSTKLNAPVQSLVADPDGAGYWLVASDGGIFAFDADFYGSMGSVRLNRPVTGMVGATGGYLMVAEDGGIFTFGSAPFHGSLGDHPPTRPVVAVATLP
jgi:uncharacterized delta-60 repeat protein